MILNRTTAPAALISTADAKEHLRVDFTAEDTLIDGYVAAAVSKLDGPSGAVGKALVTQSWTMQRERITGRCAVVLPVVPFQSLTSVSYYDSDNQSQTLLVADFTVYAEEDNARLVPDIGTNWPAMYDRPDALTIVWAAGFGAASAVPANIVVAAKQALTFLYENRGDEDMAIPRSIADLAGVSRIGWVG